MKFKVLFSNEESVVVTFSAVQGKKAVAQALTNLYQGMGLEVEAVVYIREVDADVIDV